MANLTEQFSRIRIKRSTTALEVPTVPASDDHTDGTWLSTDIYKGELFINLPDGKIYTRTDSGIVNLPSPADLVGLLDFKGGYDAATNTPDLDVSPSGVLKGDVYVTTVAGVFFTENLEIGDMIFAEIDNPVALTDWTVVNKNITTGSGVGQHQINGAILGISEIVQTDASREFITVAARTAYNADFGTTSINVPEIGGAGLTGSEVVQTNASGKLITQPVNTAHNKNFGTSAGTVAEGNHDHVHTFTGSYTGDDTTARGITGIGFQPKYVKIWQSGASDGDAMFIFEKTDVMTGTLCIRKSDTNAFQYKDNRLTSLDADGFTIDDNGANAHPNKSGTTYRYIAIK